MKRRFMNLVMHKWAEGVYSVRRIDPYHLFYRSAKAALVAADEAAKRKASFPAMQTLQLPHPNINYSTTPKGASMDMFALLSPRATCEGRLVAVNAVGEAVLYDLDKQIISRMSCQNEAKGIKPMCLHVTHPGTHDDSVYVMNRYPRRAPGRCFEVLEFMPIGKGKSLGDRMATWRWRLLPPPPFVCQPRCEPSSAISYTAVVDSTGCSTIFVSCDGDTGTYSFETARRDSSRLLGWRHSEEWKHIGEWKLPFIGRAEYVPELNLWLGFSAYIPNYLCDMDLSPMDKDRQPTAQLDTPEGGAWVPTDLRLLNLGDGKFLIAKTIEVVETGKRFAVLTGVEIMRGFGDGQRLQMVKHKCARYAFTNETIQWVL